MKDLHAEGVEGYDGSVEDGIQGSVENAHVISEGFAKEWGDGVRCRASRVGQWHGVETNSVDVHEWDFELVDDAQRALRVGSVEDNEIKSPS